MISHHARTRSSVLRYLAVISAIALCRGLLGIAYLNKKNTGVQEFRTSGLQDFRSSGLQEFRTSGLQDFRTSGLQENPEPEDHLSIKEIELNNISWVFLVLWMQH